MDTRKFFTGYIRKPLVIWAIFFNIIIKLTFIPEIFDFVEWLVVSQIYLPIFAASFVYTYLQQMVPIYMTISKIKEKQAQNRWVVPRLMSNRLAMNVALWLSAVLFFVGIMMSFGTLYSPSIVDKEKFFQLQVTLPMIGFVLLPLVSMYYSMDFQSYLKKIEINLRTSLDIIVSSTFLAFFIVLSYVATLCFITNK